MSNKNIIILALSLCVLMAAVAYVVYRYKQNGATVTTKRPTIEIEPLTLEEFDGEIIDDYIIIDGRLVRKADL